MRAGRSRGAKRAARVHRGDGAGRRARDVPVPGRVRRRLDQARRDGEPVRAARSAAGAIGSALARVPVNRYPDGERTPSRRRLRQALALPDDVGLMLGNGSDELIQILTTAVAAPRRVVLAPEPSFVMYRRNALISHARFVGVPLRDGFHARRRRDAGGDRAGTPGARVARLSEQSDRQPVRRLPTSSASSALRRASSRSTRRITRSPTLRSCRACSISRISSSCARSRRSAWRACGSATRWRTPPGSTSSRRCGRRTMSTA